MNSKQRLKRNMAFNLTIRKTQNCILYSTTIFSVKEEAIEQLIHRSLENLEEILIDHRATKETLYTLRDNIQQMTEGCADNIKIVIYLDGVLGGFIEITAGQKENRLRITIKSNGEMKHSWNKLKTIKELELTRFTVEAGEVPNTIQKVLRNLKLTLKDHAATRTALRTVRDEIQDLIEKYAGNVTVVIYLDDVLDDHIEIKVGQAENKFRVTIKSNGDVTYGMKKELLVESWNFFKTEIIRPIMSNPNRLQDMGRSLKEVGLYAVSLISVWRQFIKCSE